MVCVLTFISQPLDLSIKIECSCHKRGYLALRDDKALLHTHLTEHKWRERRERIKRRGEVGERIKKRKREWR
jgi:hypothetical protein